jgi:LacI family sucrose operon transcriptional repressor
MMNVSIGDVAKKAGVAKSTVSRVMNGGSASLKTAEAVKQAMDELSYQPSSIARSLRGIRTKIIGVGLSNYDIYLKPHIGRRLMGLQKYLADHGYTVLLITDEKEVSYFDVARRYLQEGLIDAFFMMGHSQKRNLEVERELIRDFHNVIYTGDPLFERKGFRVYMGNYDYSRDAYHFLFANGHYRILTISDLDNGMLMSIREKAYLELCTMYHVQPAENHQMSYGGTPFSLKQIFDTFVNGAFTAIFVDDGNTARLIRNYFESRKLKNPQDYSLICIERDETRLENSDLTCIILQDYEYGVKAGELITDVLQNESLKWKDVSVSYKFYVRDSVRNINGQRNPEHKTAGDKADESHYDIV